jgi:hypothetical protein
MLDTLKDRVYFIYQTILRKIGNFLHPRKCLEDASLIPAGLEFLYLLPRVDRFWSPFSLLWPLPVRKTAGV